jgi:hypothetical protein
MELLSANVWLQMELSKQWPVVQHSYQALQKEQHLVAQME